MDRYLAKSLILFLLVAPLSGAAFLSPKQNVGSRHEAMTGTVFAKPGPARLEQSVSDSSGLLQYTAAGHVIGFRTGGVVIASGNHALRVEYINARPVPPSEEKSSEFKNDRGVSPPLGKVTYRDLWAGVTAVYEKSESGVVKSTYNIQPGETKASNPAEQIKLRYSVPVKIDSSGNLVLSFASGEMQETRPVAWQEVAGKKISVEARYRLLETKAVGFEVEAYDVRYPLVIDPVISWSTFLGGTSLDRGYAIAVDSSGNTYVIGCSAGTWGSPIRPYTEAHDAFVAKLDANGTLLWNTFLGTSDYDDGYGIAVDTNGNVYVTGSSWATWGSPLRAYAGIGDAFVTKLNADGALLWNTFLGGTSYDCGNGIAVDTNGSCYVGGNSSATWGSPIRPIAAGESDGFVAKLDASGVLIWNTFLGGAPGDDDLHGIAVDTNGNSYVAGWSLATWGLPLRAYAGGYDAFVAKLATNGTLLWNTFLGGANNDQGPYGNGIAVDTNGNTYVTGYSQATWGSPLRAYAGSQDGFVAKLTTNGALQWNTFMGGLSDDGSSGIAVDTSGNSYVAGWSEATWGLPLRAYAGSRDTFVAKLTTNGALQWNTFMGGLSDVWGSGIAVDTNGNSYVAGWSMATWGWPVRQFAGGWDAYVAKVPANPVPPSEIVSLSPSDKLVGDSSFVLTVEGSGFVDGAVVRWNGADRPTTFISSSEISAAIGADDLTAAKIVQITVRNPDGEITNASEFTIKNVVPSLSTLTPSSASAGDPGFTLVVTGSAFVDGTIVSWDGADRSTSFVNSSEVSATIGAGDLAAAKTVQVTVRNPGSGASNALEFTISDPRPILTALVPSSASAGSSGFILCVMGSKFVSGTIVRWGGSDRPTTFVNSNEVDATIGADDIASAKSVQVTVRNPDGETSIGLIFVINNPPYPSLTALSPVKISGGGAGFNLTLLGTNFVANSVARWNGIDKTTTYISSTELRAAIPAGDISVGREVQVTVLNPIPAGSTSNALVFPVSSFTMNSSPTSATVTAGQSAAYAVQVIPQFGSFDSSVSFTCTGLPRGCTASISPASVTPGANVVATALTLTTSAASGSAAGVKLGSAGFIPPAFELLLAILALLRWLSIRKPVPKKFSCRWLTASALICVIALLASCGTGGDSNPPANNGTPPGTYQITVQGESGSLKTSTTVTLVVR